MEINLILGAGNKLTSHFDVLVACFMGMGSEQLDTFIYLQRLRQKARPVIGLNRAIFMVWPLMVFLGGCSLLQGGKLYAPETFGFVPIASNIYVEAGTDEATQAGLREAMEKAEIAIRAAYGSTKSHPVINACITEQCLASFGGKGAFAKVYGNRILLSLRGMNWHFIAHEWSHAEMSTRLNLSAWSRMPQRFDEGIAVAISEAPEHLELHWQFLVVSNIARPTSEELHTFRSLNQWREAGRRYSDNKNAER